MDGLPIAMPREEIVAFCGRNHIQRLSLFGFILTKRFRDQSDVDLLVEFEPGHVPGLLGIARMEAELSQILGRKADLRTARDLSRPSAATYSRPPCCSILHIFRAMATEDGMGGLTAWCGVPKRKAACQAADSLSTESSRLESRLAGRNACPTSAETAA